MENLPFNTKIKVCLKSAWCSNLVIMWQMGVGVVGVVMVVMTGGGGDVDIWFVTCSAFSAPLHPKKGGKIFMVL